MIDFNRRILWASLLAMFCTPGVFAVEAGMTDTFNNDAQGWGIGGGRGPVGPPFTELAHTSTGLDEGYVTIVSDGLGQGGKPTAYNPSRWGGDYIAEGIAGITMDVNNVGATDLVLKLFTGNFAQTHFGQSTGSVTVTAGSGWQSVYFGLGGGEFDGLFGQDREGALRNVDFLRIFHSPNGELPNDQGPTQFIVAELQIDNIHANPVPVPPAIVFLLSGIVGLWTRGRIGS